LDPNFIAGTHSWALVPSPQFSPHSALSPHSAVPLVKTSAMQLSAIRN
jgi:hypothetical protein